MYQLIESADYHTLLEQYLDDYRHYCGGILADTPLIVPTLSVGNILLQTIAAKHGVAGGITLYHWRNYEWQLIERITGKVQLRKQAPLSNTAIHWELFSWLYRHGDHILADPTHPQHALLRSLWPQENRITAAMTRHLWTSTGELANLYSTYLNQRPDWIRAWQNEERPTLDELLPHGTLARQPPELAAHYRALYQQQSSLWHERFAAVYRAREARHRAFWHALEHEPAARRQLPPYLPLFALNHLSAEEYRNIRRLGEYTRVYHYHLSASDGYIDDIVDSRWLRELKHHHPQHATDRHYDHGHTLVSRYGKEQRGLARLLHPDDSAANHRHGTSPAITAKNLLTALQAEIRELREDLVATVAHDENDHSLRIHGCHGLQRQCEILRSDIAAWLNADPDRRLSDIYIHLPDPAAAQTTLRAIFPPNGDYDGNRLPARIVGISENTAETLWHSLAGHYRLINSRFDAPTVLDWLHNEHTCQALGISTEHMQHITAALIAAGYKRGFDPAHLQTTLHPDDHDHRYTYTYALNRLIVGIFTPEAEHYQEAVPQNGLGLADLPALEALATLADNMHELRARQNAGTPAQEWLHHLCETLQHRYSHAQNTPAWQTIDQAIEELQSQLDAHQELAPQNETHYLPLPFILEHIENALAARQNRSEPSGVITIGSLKNLRNLPGKLLVFLNADHDCYPARQNDERYNLIRLDHARPGDHNREHEDLAALLDLINRAGENLWIYYNSTTPGDNEPQPPAGPVQELLRYLDDQRHDKPCHYHIEHPAEPFWHDPGETRPAPLWQQIRQTLAETHAPPAPYLNLSIPPAPAADATPLEADNHQLEQLIRDIQKPANAYAHTHHIADHDEQRQPARNEPLALDGLQNWQAAQHLITALEQQHPDPEKHIARLPAYPGGISGQIALVQAYQTYRKRQQILAAYIAPAPWPHCREQTIDLGGGQQLSACLPENSRYWPRLSASRSKKYYIRHWLEHLAWNAGGKGGDSLIYYNDNIIYRYHPLAADEAARQLRQWLTIREHIRKNLWLAPVELMQDYLENLDKKDGTKKNRKKIEIWIKDTNKKTSLWRHLWRGNEETLVEHIEQALALHTPLLRPLLEHRETITA